MTYLSWWLVTHWPSQHAEANSNGRPRLDPSERVRWVKGAGAARRVHSPRDMGKRNAEKRAAGPATLAIRWRLQVFFVCARNHRPMLAGHSLPDGRARAGSATGTQSETMPPFLGLNQGAIIGLFYLKVVQVSSYFITTIWKQILRN